MDIVETVKKAAAAFCGSEKSGEAGSALNISTVVSALTGLLGQGGGLNIATLVSGLKSGALSSIVDSWLGDNKNEGISPEQVKETLGAEKVSAFADELGLSEDEAAGGLADALPELVDKSSSGGSLLDSIGVPDGVANIAKKFGF